MNDKPDRDAIIDALAHFLCSQDESPSLAGRARRAMPKDFDGFEIIDPSDKDFVVLCSAAPNDQPVWPMNVCWGGGNKDGWWFNGVRTTQPSEWRGKARITGPKMVEFRGCNIDRDGATRIGIKTPIVISGRKAVYAQTGRAVPASDEGMTNALEVASGFALRRRYYWSVLLGEGEGPRARFITDVMGVRDAFRFRDLPPGKMRRSALRHWVSEHWRKGRDETAADKAWVREHMRGAVSFEWNGFRCEIEPSMEDIERAEAAKQKT